MNWKCDYTMLSRVHEWEAVNTFVICVCMYPVRRWISRPRTDLNLFSNLRLLFGDLFFRILLVRNRLPIDLFLVEAFGILLSAWNRNINVPSY